ncbi:MAG: Bax inhibitor-1 family protein [Promethearchaeota archaeon]
MEELYKLAKPEEAEGFRVVSTETDEEPAPPVERHPDIIARNVALGFGWLIVLMAATSYTIMKVILGEWFATYSTIALVFFFDMRVILGTWIIMVILSLVLYFGSNLHGAIKWALLTLFGIISGGFMGPVTAIAALLGVNFNLALAITGAVFVVPVLIGWMTKRDLTDWLPWIAGLLLIGLAASVINVFYTASWYTVLAALLVILIFVPIIIYDINLIKNQFADNEWQAGVVDLFLDFLNVLLRIIILLIEIAGAGK